MAEEEGNPLEIAKRPETHGAAEDYMSRLAQVCAFAVPARCPFCTAIASPPLIGGEEVFVLSGVFVGLRARIVPPPYPKWLNPGEVLLEPLEGDGSHFTFNQRGEIAQRLPGLDRPDWYPPISLVDAAELHDAILRFCLRHNWDEIESVDWRQFYVLVEHVWRRRLPLEPDEMGVLLQRHGLPKPCLTEVVNLFRHCRDVLVTAVGRKPVKKKRADHVPRRRKR
jgi:hypothetical protein